MSENQQAFSDSAVRHDDNFYDSDDVGLHNSPPLKPLKIKFEPSPSPPPVVPLPEVTPESSPGPGERKGPSRPKYRPSQGDAVLVLSMAGGKHYDVARDAGDKPLASDNEEEEESGGETKLYLLEDEAYKKTLYPSTVERGGIDLTALARDALRQAADGKSRTSHLKEDAQIAEIGTVNDLSPRGESVGNFEHHMPSVANLHVNGTSTQALPQDIGLKHDIGTSQSGELPPIRPHSTQASLTNGHSLGQITLPSIADQLGDIKRLPETTVNSDSTFSQSPRPPPRFPTATGSSPKSPNDVFRRELPSPGRGHFYFNPNSHRRSSQTDSGQYAIAADYSSSNTETPSTDHSSSTPATTTVAIDCMSIDGITNPQIGGFVCNFTGCNAPPFQTQYLLNSHANVHSSNRPHYCSVKGCPRSEGGKGFKRKNEMIRHGLVHDSPGYVCPFCPDREHKYPRPDNLQRHVRVHHVDKDKDDQQLRDVLAQRPEGPSRGRRRRGGTA